MMLFRITGEIVHHTNDEHCVSVDKPKNIIPFLIDGSEHNITTCFEALYLAKQIVCPVELQYESVTVNLRAELMKHPSPA